MEAPVHDHESWQPDFNANVYEDHKVESTLHQPFDDRGEQKPRCRDGDQEGIQQSGGQRGGISVHCRDRSGSQQPPTAIGAKYLKGGRSTLQDRRPLPNSDCEDGDKRQQTQQTLRSCFSEDEDRRRTESSLDQFDYGVNNTQEPHRDVGNVVTEPTLEDAREIHGGPNLLQLPHHYFIRNAREEPPFPVNPVYCVEESQGLWRTASHSGVQNLPTSLVAPPDDGIDGAREGGQTLHCLQTTTEQGRDKGDANDNQEALHGGEGVQFLEQLRQLMCPSVIAADHEYQERSAGMEGSISDQGQAGFQDTVNMLLANSSLVNASLAPELHDGSPSTTQFAHWHAAHPVRWYNDHDCFLSNTLPNSAEYPLNPNPSGEGSSGEFWRYATQEMTLDFETSHSLPAGGFMTPISTSAPDTFSQNGPFFTSIESDGYSSFSQPESVQFASHREWGGYLSHPEDCSGTHTTADLVSHVASSNSQTPLELLSVQENWQYNLREINLAALKNTSGQIPLRPLLQNVAAGSTQAAALGWGLPDASVSILKDAAESIKPENMSIVSGDVWNPSQPHVPEMHKTFAEESKQRQMSYRLDGDARQETQRERQGEENRTIYWGDDNKQQQCLCEECQSERGTGTVLTLRGNGHDEQRRQCACEECQLQMRTGADMTSEHKATEGQQVLVQWQESGDGISVRTSSESVHCQDGNELLTQVRPCTLACNDQQQGHSEGTGSGYATDYDGNDQQQVQIDYWPDGIRVGQNLILQASDHDQQSYYDSHQTEREQMQPSISEEGVKYESDSEEAFGQQEDGDDMEPGSRDCKCENVGESSERWEEGHARLKRKLTLWKQARFRARVVTHPLFPELLQAHIDCVRMMTPACKQDEINQQLEDIQSVYEKYIPFAPQHTQVDDIHLDQFLKTFLNDIKNYQSALANNLKVQATPAYARLWRTERTLFQLTGIRIPSRLESGSTMSDDSGNDASDDSDIENTAGGATDGFVHDPNCEMDAENDGSYAPTAADRAAMDSIRQDLISRFGVESYRKQIKEVRDEILRKRRAGKLPEGTTSILKAWWDEHSNWPYPTEEEKEQLIKETGLELKQVNNWFINQRKRNWNNNPLAANKEKRRGDVLDD